MPLRFLPEPTLLGALDEARTARLLEERTRLLARRMPAEAASVGDASAPVLVLALGRETFGLDLALVAEVVPAEPTSLIPGAPPAILGLRARAGRLHSVLDLAALLGLPPYGAAGQQHDVLLRQSGSTGPGGRRFALRVDRALSAQRPVPVAADRAPARAGGPVAFHALLPNDAAESTLIAVLDLGRLLQPYLRPSASNDLPSGA
jgi:purine-binding chemotaxis protein CheW